MFYGFNSGFENNLLEVFKDLFSISYWINTDLLMKILLSSRVTKQGFVQDRVLNVIFKFNKYLQCLLLSDCDLYVALFPW